MEEAEYDDLVTFLRSCVGPGARQHPSSFDDDHLRNKIPSAIIGDTEVL